MDILKKGILAIFILLVFTQIMAQKSTSFSDDDILTAFISSYKYESSAQYKQAIDALQAVYSSNNYEINLRLGWLYYLNAQQSESQQYYQKAIDLMPKSIEARLGYANSVAAKEDWVKLESIYMDILAIDPNNSSVLYKLGLIYYYRADYQKAYNNFYKVINMYPFDYSTMLMMGWTNYQLGKTMEAELFFKKTLLYSPYDESALEGLDLLKK